MNFTKNTILSLEAINDNLLFFNDKSFVYNRLQLKEFLSMGNYYNKCLRSEFEDYGYIESLHLYGEFKDEVVGELNTFVVRSVYSVLKCVAFNMAKDNYLTLQQTKIFLMQLETKNII